MQHLSRAGLGHHRFRESMQLNAFGCSRVKRGVTYITGRAAMRFGKILRAGALITMALGMAGPLSAQVMPKAKAIKKRRSD